MNSNVVLDASALLALIHGEQSAEVIKPLLKFSMMSAVNVAESLSALKNINIPPQEALTFISDIIGSIVPFDFEQAKNVAGLQLPLNHKGLSLGDLACIALGIKLQIPIYTTDKAWLELDLNDANIKLIY